VKSVGATSLGVAGIFLIYGAAVGVVGGAMGSIIGTVFVWYINEFQDLLAWISPQAKIWSPEVYSFERIPNHVEAWDVTVVYVVAIIASMVGSVIAAVRAARIWPVEALRYE
jgi:lipoprotein-releasing system permease protein